MTGHSRIVSAFVAFALLGSGNIAQAQYAFFPNDATISTPISSYYNIVGYAGGSFGANTSITNFSTPSSPTINLVNGGDVYATLFAYNNSIVNLSGGRVGGTLYSNDSSTVNMSAGSVFLDQYALGKSVVNVSGGSIGRYLQALGNSFVNMSGGNVGSYLYARESSRVNFSGGYVNVLLLEDDSLINITGGNVQNYLLASMNATMNISGGTGAYFQVANRASLNFFGTSLSASLANPNTNGYSLYSVSGQLLDGTILTNKNLYVQNGTGARFTITNVPEPSCLAFAVGFGLNGVSALLKRRRRN